jgi:nucleotide-binding universal stress UspA family protein
LGFVGDDVDVVATGVFPTSSWTAGIDQSVIEQEAQRAEQAFHAVVDGVEQAAERSVPVQRHFSVGAPGKVLSDASEECDLMVVGAHAGGRIESLLLGSVAAHVLHHAACPVAVIPVDPPG